MFKQIVAVLFLLATVITLQAHDKQSPQKQSKDHLLSITTEKGIVVAFDLPIEEK